MISAYTPLMPHVHAVCSTNPSTAVCSICLAVHQQRVSQKRRQILASCPDGGAEFTTGLQKTSAGRSDRCPAASIVTACGYRWSCSAPPLCPALECALLSTSKRLETPGSCTLESQPVAALLSTWLHVTWRALHLATCCPLRRRQ
jgi:hypothetical protein